MSDTNKLVEEAPYHPGYEDAAMAPTFKISVQEEIDRAYQRGFEDGKVFGRYAGYQEAKGDGGNH